jgi:GntP family gluconate:H+ symporter
MDVPQTLKTWSAMETVISVVALGFVMLLSVII